MSMLKSEGFLTLWGCNGEHALDVGRFEREVVDLFCLLRSDIGMATEGARAPVHVGEPRRTEGVWKTNR